MIKADFVSRPLPLSRAEGARADTGGLSTSMRKDIILPGLALVGGAAGFALRRWQLASAWCPEAGLFLHGAPATLILLVTLGAVLLALLLLARGERRRPTGFLDAFACPQAGQMTVITAAGLLMAAAGLLGLADSFAQWQQGAVQWMGAGQGADPMSARAFQTAACLLALPGALGLLQMGRGAYRGEESGRISLLAPFPAMAGLCWMFSVNLRYSTEPVLMRYGLSLAAAGLLMLAHLHFAGFLFGRSRPRRAVFYALAGALLGLTALADGPAWWEAALTLAFVLSALAFARALLLPRPAWTAEAVQS